MKEKTGTPNIQISSGELEEENKSFKIVEIIGSLLISIGIGTSIFHLFGFNFAGKVMWPRAYYALLIACFLPLVFLNDISKNQNNKKIWINTLGAVLSFCIPMFFFLNGDNIEYKGWVFKAPLEGIIAAIGLVGIIIWALKKSTGLSFFIVAMFFMCFPLFSHLIPGDLRGIAFEPLEAILVYAYGTQAVFGLVMDVMCNIVIGFLIFAGVLNATGGGDFFLNLAFSLVGKSRGGPAKVAVISSGLFGSINGAPIVNVATTGAITIPAMKKLGYSARYAGAIEACASTGGVLMPPIMGATAFIMCQVLGVSYSVVITAAFVPAILYYTSLIIQVDAYAARVQLKGLSSEDVPDIRTTLKDGWPYLVSLVVLIIELLVFRIVILAPYYATLMLLITVGINKRSKLNRKFLLEMLHEVGDMISKIMALLLGVGFVIGALMMTGVAFAFSYEVIKMAMGNPILLLVFGALISFVLGMGMTISAVYVILAMTVAPPLVQMGFNPLAVHLFVMYYGMLSGITPPVAITAFAAAAISGDSPMKTGYMATRIGIILFIVPFVFVLKPALIFQGSIVEMLYLFITFLIGIVFVVGGTEGYVYKLGILGKEFYSPFRLMSLLGGLLVIIPNPYLKIIGGLIIISIIIATLIKKKSRITA